MSDLGPFCSTCGGDRGTRIPADADGLGCRENIWHTEDDPPRVTADGYPVGMTIDQINFEEP